MHIGLAGTSAMALIRSSLLNIRLGSQDFQVGGGELLNIYLRAMDDAIDRQRSIEMMRAAARVDARFDFDDVVIALPELCLAGPRSISDANKKVFAADVDSLRKSESDERVKLTTLGVLLYKLVGEEVLQSGLDEMRKIVELSDSLSGDLEFEAALRFLPEQCDIERGRPLDTAVREQLTAELLDLHALDVSEHIKLRRLGLVLGNAYGIPALARAVRAMRPDEPEPGATG
jgi:hypothetical protein